MNEKKGTRPDVAASERAKGPGAACRQTTHSVDKFTISTSPGQELHIADFLSYGQENAISLRELKNLLHLDGRAVRLMIRAERLSGTPILSNNQTGYIERLHLRDKFPRIYEKFSRESARLPGDWRFE